MKIGITTGSPENNFATLLIHELKAFFPDFQIVILSTEKKGIRNFLRRIGFNKMMRLIRNRGNCSYLDREVKFKIGMVGSLYSYTKRLDIPYYSFSSFNAPESLKSINSFDLDYIINCGGGIFRKGFISSSKYGVLNAHMGKLPEIRGMNALEWSILKGVELGVTLHYIDSGIDTGNIISFKPLKLNVNDSIKLLRERSNLINIDLIVESFRNAKDHPILSEKQNEDKGEQHYIMHHALLQIVNEKLTYEKDNFNI